MKSMLVALLLVALSPMALLLSAPEARAAELLLSPGGGDFSSLDADETVVWTDWIWECSCQVLDLPASAESPADVTAVRFMLGSSNQAFDHHSTTVAVGLTLLEPGEEPTKLPGISQWDWVETWFNISISSEHMTEVPMTQVLPPSWPLRVEDQRIAVWICGVDPDEEEADDWPTDAETGDVAGLVVDPDLPGDDSYLWVNPMLLRLSDLGLEGGWAIQAVVDDAGKTVPDPFALSTISPDSTPLGQVAEVELTGEGFQDGLMATIGGLDIADLDVVDETTATGRSPSGLPAGFHDVRLLSADGDEALLTTAFEVVEAEADGGAAGDGGGSADGGATSDGGAPGDGGSGGAEDEGCSCQAGAAGGGWLLVAGLLGWRRRRD